MIGYSVSGFGDLSYVSKKTVAKADKLADKLWNLGYKMTKDTAKTIAKILHTVKKLQEKFEKERDEELSKKNFVKAGEKESLAIGVLCSYSEILQTYWPEDCFKILEELKEIEGE